MVIFQATGETITPIIRIPALGKFAKPKSIYDALIITDDLPISSTLRLAESNMPNHLLEIE